MSDKLLLILASNSPRRRELLGITGFMFSTLRVHIDETPLPNEPPREYTLRLSRQKAEAALDLVPGQPIILAADTTVVDRGEILGKPAHAGEAESMLKQLRGKTHQVYTGIAVLDVHSGRLEQEVAVTDVPMREYTDAEIAAYIASGDPFDKAGGYAIQNAQFHPVALRTGCYANVIGLPLCHVLKTLRRLEVPISQDVPYLCQSAHAYECGVFTSILCR